MLNLEVDSQRVRERVCCIRVRKRRVRVEISATRPTIPSIRLEKCQESVFSFGRLAKIIYGSKEKLFLPAWQRRCTKESKKDKGLVEGIC
jgi:hypothetical protein